MDRTIGAQFYTLRNHMKTIEDFDSSCKLVADMGYKIVQVSGVSLKADEMREILDKYDLKAVTTHRSYEDFCNNLDEVIEYNKILGCELCGLGMMPTECCESADALNKFLKNMEKVCDTLKQEKMFFGYHNHAFEFSKISGRMVMDYLINETDSDVFRFILDTYWLQVGGQNPAKFIEMLEKRAMAVHFKDLKITFPDCWTPSIADVGEGTLNWGEIITACDKAGTKWALVEHDDSQNPFESLKASYDYLTTKGFC